MSTQTATFVPSDQDVRDRVITETDRNFCVEAGAGTGKTTVMVARIVEVLRSGHATIDDVAVITFTEKAAAELAARVRIELEKAVSGANEGSEEQGRLQDALIGLHRGRIETIHAFAANILRERPVEARLDPNFEVLDSLAAELAFKRAFDEWVEQLLGDDGVEDEDLRRILNRGFDLKQIEDCARAVHEHRDALPLQPYDPVNPDVTGYVRLVEQIDSELREIAARCTDESDRGFQQVPLVTGFADEIALSAGNESRVERLILTRAPEPRRGAGRKASYSGAGDSSRLKELIGDFRDETEALQKQLEAESMATFLPRVERFVLGYERDRQVEGQAEFTDLLLWARNLVASSEMPEVANYFRGRFKTLLVDEFQDTDPVQAELIVRIASEIDSDAADWTELPLRPGALFVVGDPKQSIYRFRRADMTIYDGIKHGVLAGCLCELRQNFRSTDEVLDWANRVFDEVLVEDEGVQPRNTHLVAVPDLPSLGDSSSVVVLHGEQPAANQRELRVLEGQQLAALIKLAIEGDEPWKVRDPRTGAVRDAQWRDVAVVVPARTELELYERAFENVGLQYRHEGNRAFFQRQEVRDLTNCLYAIDDPTDKISLVAALRSSAFACSDEDLFMFTADKGKLNYRAPEPPEGHERVTEALESLLELHRKRRQTSLPELVHEVLARTSMLESALTDPVGGVQAAGNLLKVVDQARAFSGAGGGGLRPFARWLATSSDPEQEEAEASIVEETDDVVRVLTIHAAKGLEFPIVVLANSDQQPQINRQPFVDRSTGRLHVYGTYGWLTPGFNEAWENEKLHHKAERDRMLYVATTRARDHLVIARIERTKGDAKGMMKRLAPHLPEWDDDKRGQNADGCHLYDRGLLDGVPGRDEVEEVEPDDSAVAQALKAREAWAEGRDEAVATADAGLPWVTASGQEKWEERAIAGEGGDGEAGLRISRADARAIGTALHKVMEVVDLATGEDLEAIATAMCVDCGVPDAVEEVVGMARNCLGSDVVKRAVASGEYWREVPFTVPREDGGFEVGQMDLVFREGGGLVVVDYKTDRPSEGQDLPAIYGPQMEIYRSAAGALGASSVEVFLLAARLQ